jgi:hypothetical protein
MTFFNDADSDSCCDEKSETYVYRVIIADLDSRERIDHIRAFPASSKQSVSYKALSRINGNNRKKIVTEESSTILTKAAAGRQIASGIVSSLVPGDMSPVRSPIGSAAWRTITPGFGGGRGGSRPGENRGYRCPEGYQYGGRFTDNRLSTCGAKLFDIPSPLRAIARALMNAGSVAPGTITGREATGVAAPSDLINRRAPQIPRVSTDNPNSVANRLRELKQQMSQFNASSNDKVARMIRKDGFVLQPVVPPSVLRAIPDNRDMEGATYLRSALEAGDIGGEELGLLSNTGIRSLVYVLPKNSSITIEKARQLTVGERRKLGRVVNTAMEQSNASDPAKRLRFVAQEIGDGIKVTEEFAGMQNPNSVVNGSRKWVNELFKKRKLVKPKQVRSDVGRERSDEAIITGKRRLIKDLDRAIAHIANGGEFNDIDPAILAQVLSRSEAIQKQRIADNIQAIVGGGKQYFLYENPSKFQHLGERFAADVQEHLGLSAPDIIVAGKPGDSRQYLREDVETVVPNGTFDPEIDLLELDPRDVARVAIADFLTDQRERQLTSMYPINTPDGPRVVLAQNTTSGLTDLSKIQITERIKARLRDYYESKLVPSYSDYYQALKSEQRLLFLQFLTELIERAREFNKARFRASLKPYGLSEGERIHIEIMMRLFDTRLGILSSQKDVLRGIIRGGAQ